jgi:hypothetical protein
MAEPKLGQRARSPKPRSVRSRSANTSRRRLPVDAQTDTDATGIRKKETKSVTQQLQDSITQTLYIWELIAVIIIQILQGYIRTRQVMQQERKSLIPIIVRNRLASDAAPATNAGTMETGQQNATLTPSTQSGGSQPIQIQMPQPGTVGAPWFTGTNVSDFLSEFDSMCDDAHLTDAARITRVHRYCYPEISRYLKGIPEWEDGDWDTLKTVMRKEWEGTDDFQHTRTLTFLEVLKN